jgi:thiamine pyrophosphate-dependent enzyme
LNQRLKGQPWALAHSHGARWRDVLETTDEGHGLGGGRGAGVGYGLPSSIGAALGWKGSGRLVVSVLGDGDFFMTSNALWTAAKYDIPLLVIIYNNLPRKCRSSRRFHGLQSDLIAKALEPPTQALLNPKAIPFVEVVGPQVKVRLLVGQHVVDNDENGMSNGD